MPDQLLHFSTGFGGSKSRIDPASRIDDVLNHRLRDFANVESVVHEWRTRFHGMPASAAMALAARATQRVEPLRRLDLLLLQSFATGGRYFTRSPYFHFAAVVAVSDSSDVHWVAASRIVGSIMVDIHASDAIGEKAHVCRRAAEWDFETASLPFRSWGKHDVTTFGFGSLWPENPPAWCVTSEKFCQELEVEGLLAGDSILPLPSDDMMTRFASRDALDQMRHEGKLDRYAGKYVVSDGRTIFASGQDLVKVRPAAEKKATRKGIRPELLVDYFVPIID